MWNWPYHPKFVTSVHAMLFGEYIIIIMVKWLLQDLDDPLID